MFAGRPIIGIVGGIGSGKSFVADLFGELGCLVIHSDKLAHDAYNDASVQRELTAWWGPRIFEGNRIDRRAVARIIFADPVARRRLEALIFPWIAVRRKEMMEEAAGDAKIAAFVWDSPLLVETGLDRECDAVVYVNAAEDQRLGRVGKDRGWDRVELERREKLQDPLDKKREISEYVIDNTADADYARGQVENVLSRIRGH